MVSMVVTVSFDQHMESHDEENIFYPSRSYKFSYVYTRKHSMEDTPENTEKVISYMKEAKKDEIFQRAKQLAVTYMNDTGADLPGEQHIAYSVKYE